MASPHVAGLVALLWSASPELIGDIDRTEQIITGSSHHYLSSYLCPQGTERCSCGQESSSSIPNNLYGYGFVDAWMSVQASGED